MHARTQACACTHRHPYTGEQSLAPNLSITQNRRRRPAAQFEQVFLPSVRVTSCPGAEGGGGEKGVEVLQRVAEGGAIHHCLQRPSRDGCACLSHSAGYLDAVGGG